MELRRGDDWDDGDEMHAGVFGEGSGMGRAATVDRICCFHTSIDAFGRKLIDGNLRLSCWRIVDRSEVASKSDPKSVELILKLLSIPEIRMDLVSTISQTDSNRDATERWTRGV